MEVVGLRSFRKIPKGVQLKEKLVKFVFNNLRKGKINLVLLFDVTLHFTYARGLVHTSLKRLNFRACYINNTIPFYSTSKLLISCYVCVLSIYQIANNSKLCFNWSKRLYQWCNRNEIEIRMVYFPYNQLNLATLNQISKTILGISTNKICRLYFF